MEEAIPDIFEVIGDSTGIAAEAGAEVSATELYEAADSTSALNDRKAETATFAVENPSRLHVLSKLSESPEAGGEEAPEEAIDSGKDKEATGGRRFAALLGTMTHKLMEMLVTTRNGVDAKAAVGEIFREYSTPGMEDIEAMLTEKLLGAAHQIRNRGYQQSNGLPQDILGTLLTADEVYCEVPFCYKDQSDDGEVIWNGIMDAVYAVEGQWHIIDYKTNADGSDLDTRYQGQLSAYVKAFKSTTGFDADARTYHIDI